MSQFPTESQLRANLVRAGNYLWQRNLIGGTEGNLSARLDEKRLLTTPRGGAKGHLQPDDIVVIDLEGNPLSTSQPSSEIKVHLRMYEKLPNCNAVAHAHPITATAFALAGKTFESDVLPEAIVTLGIVSLVPFAMPGTFDLPDAMEEYFGVGRTFLLANHGAVTYGTDIMDAVYRMEILERVAQIHLIVDRIGGATPLPPDALQAFTVMSTQTT